FGTPTGSPFFVGPARDGWEERDREAPIYGVRRPCQAILRTFTAKRAGTPVPLSGVAFAVSLGAARGCCGRGRTNPPPAEQGGNAMSLFAHRNAVRSWKLWPTLAIALACAGCAIADAGTGKVKKVAPDEPHKLGSGRSFETQTRVELEPAPAAAPGWFSEA